MEILMAVDRRASRRWTMTAWLLVPWGLLGCGTGSDGLDRQPVTGTVTLDDRNLDDDRGGGVCIRRAYRTCARHV